LKIKKILKYNGIIIGLILLTILIFISLIGPYICKYSPKATNYSAQFSKPSIKDHLFGTDDFGRDVFSRCIHGCRLSLYIGGLSTVFIMLFGTIVGVSSSFYSIFDTIVMRFFEVMMAIPAMLLAMMIMAIFGHDANNLIIAITIVYIPQVARIVRGETLRVKVDEYIKASFAQGASIVRIAFFHVLPNIGSVLLVQATFTFAYAILTESALSFLGLGIPATEISLGLLLAEGRQYIIFAPWMTLFPGFVIMLVVLSFNLLGDGLRDYFDININKNVQ
jgi:peptide/nickel transport system permease protein